MITAFFRLEQVNNFVEQVIKSLTTQKYLHINDFSINTKIPHSSFMFVLQS